MQGRETVQSDLQNLCKGQASKASTTEVRPGSLGEGALARRAWAVQEQQVTLPNA